MKMKVQVQDLKVGDICLSEYDEVLGQVVEGVSSIDKTPIVRFYYIHPDTGTQKFGVFLHKLTHIHIQR